MQTGKPTKLKEPTPLYGDDGVLADPFKYRTKLLNIRRSKILHEREKKFNTKLFQQSVQQIPNVKYNPFTALELIHTKGSSDIYQNAAKSTIGLDTKAYITSEFDHKHTMEKDFVTALQAAKSGNKESLLNFYMNVGLNDDQKELKSDISHKYDRYDNYLSCCFWW